MRARHALLGALLTAVLGGCSLEGDVEGMRLSAAAEASVVDPPPSAKVEPAFAVADPGPLRARTVSADLLVLGEDTLPRRVVRRIRSAPGVRAVEPLSLASAAVNGRVVTIGAVDPATYRRFTPERSASATAVWRRVAEGDLAISPGIAEDLRQPLGDDVMLGNDVDKVALRVGAHASMAPPVDAVVNRRRGRQLGMVPRNAVLVSVDGAVPGVADELEGRTRRYARVSTLTTGVPPRGERTAFLTGGSLAEAVGSFTYRYLDDGTVRPDAAWAAANIRTEHVPILGHVTCHRVMLPQLRGALQEVVDSGLAARINPDDYGGCYVPRFIESDVSKGLSLHTWGIAVDLNVAGNQRGTDGQIDRRIVDIFKQWGFAWGGDWDYTDPMHFELAALLQE